MTNDVFSLELTRRYIRMCDMREVNGKFELTALGYDDILPNFMLVDNNDVVKQQAKVITQLYNNLNIHKKKVNVVIPDSLTYSQIIEMPQLKEEELTTAIKYQADEFIPMPIEDVYLDIEILKQNPKTNRQLTLIVAAPKKTISIIYETLNLCHLTPVSLENELSSIGRLVSENFFQKWGCTLMMNIGYSSTSLYVIEPTTGIILATRTLKIGFELIVRDLKINLNWDEKKAYESLRSIGLHENGSVDLAKIISPLINEILAETDQFIRMSEAKFNLKVNQILTFNLDSHIADLVKTIQNKTNIPTASFPIAQILQNNVIVNNFSTELSSFVSVIGGMLR